MENFNLTDLKKQRTEFRKTTAAENLEKKTTVKYSQRVGAPNFYINSAQILADP